MKCSALTLYRNPCKNKDIGENGICKKHTIIEANAKPKKEGKCVYIRRNNERCLKNAKCPIFFIHCTNDPYVPITPIQNLTHELNKHESWWITHDSHATYHLKEQNLYSQKIKEFLSKIL